MGGKGMNAGARPKTLSETRCAASLARKTFAGGRPAKGPRCPCGIMSAKRAADRYHIC